MVQREWSGSGNWKDHLNGSNPEEKEAEPTHTHTQSRLASQLCKHYILLQRRKREAHCLPHHKRPNEFSFLRVK